MYRLCAHAGALAVAGTLLVGCDRAGDAAKKSLTADAAAPAATAQPEATGMTGATDPAAPTPPVAGPAAPAESTTPSGPAAATPSSTSASSPERSTPAVREVTIPAGTALSVRLTTPVASDTSRPEQRVDGTLTRDVRINGVEALSAGATLRGIVTNAERSGRVKGRANVAFKFDHLAANGTVYPISTRTIARQAPATKKRDAATIGIPAAGGAIIGGIMGGGDAAVKGGVIGGAAGTAAVLATRGQEVRLQPGTVVTVRLASPLRVRIQ